MFDFFSFRLHFFGGVEKWVVLMTSKIEKRLNCSGMTKGSQISEDIHKIQRCFILWNDPPQKKTVTNSILLFLLPTKLK